MAKIAKIWAREIIGSRGNPTIESACQLDSGKIAVTSVPAGASTGSHEALDMRDQDPLRYKGKGVLKPIKIINEVLGPAVVDMDPVDLKSLDKKLIKMDGTENKSKYGANSILAVSQVVAKAGAIASGIPLYTHMSNVSKTFGLIVRLGIPTPLFNMINGGLHGAGNLDFQEFHVIPASNKRYSEGLRICDEIYITIGENLARRGAIHSVGDEGGYAPNLFTNADAFAVLLDSVKEAGYALGRDVFFGVDVAATVFFKNNAYVIRDKTSPMNEQQMLEYYQDLNSRYHLAIL